MLHSSPTNSRSFEQYVKAFASDMLHEADREIVPLNEMAIEPDQFTVKCGSGCGRERLRGKDIRAENTHACS